MTKQQLIESIETIVAEVNAMLSKHEAQTTVRLTCSSPKGGTSLDLRLVVEIVEHAVRYDSDGAQVIGQPAIEVIKLFGMTEELAVDYARCRLYGMVATLLGNL